MPSVFSRLRLADRSTTAVLIGLLLGGLLGLAVPEPTVAQNQIYVDADATGAADGSSWADAFTSLRNALAVAATGDSVWVAEGIYYPDEGTDVPADTQTESFLIPDSVAVYGGFEGTETRLSARDVTTHRTLLSGDVTQNDSDPDGDGLVQPDGISGPNSHHVVEGAASGGRLDGVYVTAGDASGSTAPTDRGGGLYVPPQVGLFPAMTIVRTRFVGNRAALHGGAVALDGADAVFSNVEMIGNDAAGGDGGALHVVGTDFGNVWMANAVFSGNTAAGSGGAVSHRGGVLELYNGTMAQNDAAADGGGLHVSPDAFDATVQASTFWGNGAGNAGPQVYTDVALTLDTAVLDGDTASVGGTGSITASQVQDAAPLFVDAAGADGTTGTPDDDLRVNWASPGIDLRPEQPTASVPDSADVDNDGDAAEPLPVDLAGQPRLQGRSVDVGAYEGGAAPQSTTVVYADSARGTDAGPSGGSWDAPYRTLQAALAAARHAAAATDGVPFEEVWVAEGTYVPDQGPGLTPGDSSAHFSLVDGVAVYGGFRNGDTFAQRDPDPATNGTVLSGDLGVPDDTSDNSETVVANGVGVPEALGPATTLDGFTVTGGTTGTLGVGGGVVLRATEGLTLSPTLRNLRITDNYATSGAGLALLVDTEATARPHLSNVDLIGNEASGIRGGLLLSAGDGTLAPDLANVRVLGNRAEQAGAFGIGTGNAGVATPTFANLLVSGNVSAADSAAAVFRNASSATLEPTFVNTTWAQNTATTDSLTALVETRDLDSESFLVQLANSILWGNAARSTVAGDAEALRIDSSLVRGGWDEPGDDNLDADPLFVTPPGPDGRPGTSDDSLQVLPGSPALEWGGTSFLPADATDLDRDGDRSERLPLDLAGETRVQGDAVDAGAYEGASGTVPAITLTPPDEPPAPGTTTPIDVTFPDDFAPSEGTFYYRPAGAPAFQTVGLDLGGVEGGSTITVDIPGSAVTQRGVQYYVQATGTLTGRPESMQLTAPTTAPTRTAFLPVRIGEVWAEGTFAPERYRMLTVPADLGDRSVFDLLETQFGPYDPRQWRVARWAPRDSSYRLGPEVDPLAPGQAAWFITAGSDSLIVNDARSADAGGPQSLSLQPGWNQIGSPFSFPVAWADVQRPDAVRAPVAYDASRPRGERYRFAAETLRPWRGAFVYNAADTTVTIRVPPVEDTTATTESRRPRTATAGTGDYRLQALATATSGDRRLQDRSTWLGFAEGAEAGFGPKDLAKPPAVGPHVRVHAVSEDGPPLARSLRPPSTEGAAWTLRVGLHLGDELSSPQTVTVRFAEQGARPNGFERYVLDPARGERLPVTEQSVTVRLTPDRPTRRLRVIVGTEAFAEQTSGTTSLAVEETTLRTNAPNPFTEATTLSYQLAERQEVTIAVYDLLGRRVETLVDGPREAGVHRTTWHATGSDGQSLASGVYFGRMEAGSYTGTQKLVLVR